MIRACAWCSPDSCGVITPKSRFSQFRSPGRVSSEELTELIGRPIKYASRMTFECRACLYAAGLALKTCDWLDGASREIGLVGAGYDGCLLADDRYFHDYVTSGRSLGRGNLFIYTLPSSTLGEVAIALGLTGPGLHIHGERDPLGTLAQQAEQFIADGETDAMLALWSDAVSAVCLAIDRAKDASDKSPSFPSPDMSRAWLDLPVESNPACLARRLALLAGSA